jgi:AcrR family transcriptional regulator
VVKRKDGLERKAMLLEEATRVFAQKGFRDTTIADICKAARSNVASVNYYFGSKDQLYAEVWKNAFLLALRRYPLDGGLTAKATAIDRLKALIRAHLHRMLDDGTLGHAGQILLMELSHPTEALECVKNDAITPLRKQVLGIIRSLLGNDAAEEQVALCAMSVIHQCFGFGLKRGKLPHLLGSMKRADLFEALVEHITLFSLAGISAVREKIYRERITCCVKA